MVAVEIGKSTRDLDDPAALAAYALTRRLERLTRSPGRDMHPRFSPDDRWVLFTSERGKLNDELPLSRVIFQPQPYGELHAVRLEDKAVVRLTHNKWEDGPSAWER